MAKGRLGAFEDKQSQFETFLPKVVILRLLRKRQFEKKKTIRSMSSVGKSHFGQK